MAGVAGVLLHLLVDDRGHLGREDLGQGRGAQLLHRVVLDRAAREVGVSLEGELVNGADQRGKIFLVVRIFHHLP